MRDRQHDEAMSEQLRSGPTYALQLLSEVLREGSLAEVTILLRQLAVAFPARDQDHPTSVCAS